MIEDPPYYQVGYKKPPLHSRFKKGQSGNPEGARRHRRHDQRLAALLEEALDGRMARPRRPVTRREAIVAALVEKSTGGDLRALKLLLDLVQKTELARGAEQDFDEEDPRQWLIAEIDRLAAEEEAKEAERPRNRDDSVCG